MSFTVENLEFFLLVLVRISAFVFTAPFFGLPNNPRKVKAALSVFIAIVVFQTLPYERLVYEGAIGYTGMILKEAIVGLLVGFMANVCTYILNFSGSMIDMEIGFSMVNVMNPVANMQTTVTGNFYTYFVMLMLLVTNMHHYILYAIVDAYKVIPVGEAVIQPNIYLVMIRFISDYFIIGFRIILPVFACTLLVNVVLGILAKIAPQMNMFVIGMQLKVFVGLFILVLIVGLIPAVSDFIFNEMKIMMDLVIRAMSP